MLEFMTQKREPFDFRLAWKRIADLSNQILTHYFWITRIRHKCPQDEGLLRAYPTIDNATLESSLLSIRGLDDFFGNSGTRHDDLNARDFSGFPASSSFLTKEHRATPDTEKKCETQRKLGDGGKDGQCRSKGGWQETVYLRGVGHEMRPVAPTGVRRAGRPHRPNRSATAERSVAPRAQRNVRGAMRLSMVCEG